MRRLAFIAAGMCLLFAVVAPSSAQEDTVPRPEVWRGRASSQAISVQLDRDALIPVPELFRFIALDGMGVYGSSKVEARSSLFFPGNGFILGPSLLCGTFGGQFPSQFKPIMDVCLQYKYPLTVFADSFEPDGATSGSLKLGSDADAISGNAVRAEAHAGEDAVTTDAVMQDLRVLGVPPFGPITPQIGDFEMDTSIAKVDSATSRTNQRISKGSLLVDAETNLSGISLIGGLIKIDNLRSVSQVTDDAHGARTSKPTLVMSGVTVFDQPAQFTSEGLVVGSSGSGPLDQQAQVVANELLQVFNVRATILDSEKELDKDGAAVANVGGLLIEFGRDVQGLPQIPGPLGQLDPNGFYTGSIQLGTTSALGAAFDFDDVIIDDGLTDGDSSFDPGLPATPGVFDPGEPGVPGVEVPVNEGGGDGAGGAPPTGSDDGERGLLARSIGGLFGDRIGMLYLALVFAVLGVAVAPALTVPARFGRSA